MQSQAGQYPSQLERCYSHIMSINRLLACQSKCLPGERLSAQAPSMLCIWAGKTTHVVVPGFISRKRVWQAPRLNPRASRSAAPFVKAATNTAGARRGALPSHRLWELRSHSFSAFSGSPASQHKFVILTLLSQPATLKAATSFNKHHDHAVRPVPS